MADLKKKFIDILFEDDEDEQELAEQYVEKKAEELEKKNGASYSAKDILYRKPGGSAFINLYDEPKTEVVKEKVSEEFKQEYEMSSQISPIFGILKEGEKKSAPAVVDKNLTNKPDDSHLDIITSPIYGYGKNTASNNLFDDVKPVADENEEEELHYLFDEKTEVEDHQEAENDDLNLFKLFGEDK